MSGKHLKVLGILTVALALFAFSFVGCSSSSDSGSQAEDQGSARGVGSDNTLTVGFDQDFPPYGYVGDDGQYTGFDLELAAEVAARNGWDVEFLPISWDAKDLELSSGSIDCIWNGFTIEGRKAGYSFTDPYMNNTQVVVVRVDSGIQSLSDLAGKNVMAQADSSAYGILTDPEGQAELAATFGQLQTTPDYNTAFLELEQGSVDAVAIDEPVARFQIEGKTDKFMILTETLSTEHYGVGCLLGNTELVDQIQSTLLEMDEDGFVKDLCDKYSDQGISYDNWCLGDISLDEIPE